MVGFSLNAILQKETLRRIVYFMLAATTLVITVNSYDSSIAKGPLLVLSMSLLVVVYFARTLWLRKWEMRRATADRAVAIFLLVIITSGMSSQQYLNSWEAVAFWIPLVVCFFAGTQLFVAHHEVDRLVRVLALISSAVCVVGLIQFFFADNLILEFFLGNDRRVTSTLTNASYLSGYLVLVFPLLLAYAMTRERTPRERKAMGLLLCVLAFILVLTLTRGSLVAFLISIVLFFAMVRGIRRKAMLWGTLGVAGAIVLAAYLSPALVQRVENAFSSDASSSFARRWYFWDAGIAAFKHAPFFGHGIGSFETAMLRYRNPDYWVVRSEDIVPHAHNELIETAVELGATGLIAYVVVLVSLAISGARSEPKESERDRILRAGLLCSLAAILIDNLTNMSLRVVPVAATAWLLMGVLASRPLRRQTDQAFKVTIPAWPGALAFAAWIVFAYWYGERQLDVYRADGHIIKGLFAVQSKSFAAGIAEYQKALSFHPSSLTARSNLALAYLMADKPREAIEESRELRKFSPLYPKSHLVEAAALTSLRQYHEALSKIAIEQTLRTHPDAFLYKALAYRALADTASELSALEHLLFACIKGNITYQFDPISARIRELRLPPADSQRFLNIYETLAIQFPAEQAVPALIGELQKRLKQ